MKLTTVKRNGDGTYVQALIPIMEDEMKLKCTFCVEQHGNAVKTDQLFLVSTDKGDKLACMKHKDQYERRKGHESTDDHASGR